MATTFLTARAAILYIEWLQTRPARIPVISPGLGLWVLGVSSGLGSSILAPSSPLFLLLYLGPLLSSWSPDLTPFLTPRFRPGHVVHSLPIPPLIVYYLCKDIYLDYKYTGISNLDGVGRDMATTSIALIIERGTHHHRIALKTTWEKSLNQDFAPLSRCSLI